MRLFKYTYFSHAAEIASCFMGVINMIKEERSIYAREFNQKVATWYEDREFNEAYLRSVQGYYNELLMARGYVFLRDIYERLGIPVTKESLVVGWYYDQKDPAAHNFIDFGLSKTPEGLNFLLDFNVDGDISNHF